MVKNLPTSAGDAGDTGALPGMDDPLDGRRGNLFQCSRLENPTDRGTWQATVHGAPKSWTQLSMNTHYFSNSFSHLSYYTVLGSVPWLYSRPLFGIPF